MTSDEQVFSSFRFRNHNIWCFQPSKISLLCLQSHSLCIGTILDWAFIVKTQIQFPMDLLWIYYAGNKGVDFSLDCQNALGWWKRDATTAEASRKPKQASLWSTNRAGRQKADQPTDRTQCPLITQKWYSCGQLDMFFLSWTVAWMLARLWRFRPINTFPSFQDLFVVRVLDSSC